jgi:hypothetical protein
MTQLSKIKYGIAALGWLLAFIFGYEIFKPTGEKVDKVSYDAALSLAAEETKRAIVSDSIATEANIRAENALSVLARIDTNKVRTVKIFIANEKSINTLSSRNLIRSGDSVIAKQILRFNSK